MSDISSVNKMEDDELLGALGAGLSGRLSRKSSISGNNAFLQAALSQRIVSLEYYMTTPIKEFDNMYSEFRGSSVKRVPVIRIFGSTPAGQKMCANIHGVYPYISILLEDVAVDNLDQRIASALDDAINDSVNTNTFRKKPAFQNTQHVFKVVRVTGRTFYGFRANTEMFLRIFFYNPLMLKKAVDLLQSGSILGRKFQPYESHIPYSLQFMIDYCLYGMNFVHYSKVKFRTNDKIGKDDNLFGELLPSSQSSTSSDSSLRSYVDPNSIPEELLCPTELTKSTLCELEVDVLATDIILDVNSGGKTRSVNPGINCIWKDEIERRRQQGVQNCSQITIPESQERDEVELVHCTEDKYKQILWAKLQSFYDNSNMEIGDLNGSSLLEVSRLESFLEGGHVLPSSQVHDHLSNEIENQQITWEEMTPEEDEFVNFLEVGDTGIENNANLAPSHRNINVIYNQFETEDEDGDCNNQNEDDIWNDSFLSVSILEKIPDTDESDEESEEPLNEKNDQIGAGGSRNESPILQCDGQVDDSDDSPDEKPRRSPRKTDLKEKCSTDSHGKPKKKSNTSGSSLSLKKSVSSPGNRGRRKSRRLSEANSVKLSPSHKLSLTRRRNSRSQDVKPSPASSEEANPQLKRSSSQPSKTTNAIPQESIKVKSKLKESSHEGKPKQKTKSDNAHSEKVSLSPIVSVTSSKPLMELASDAKQSDEICQHLKQLSRKTEPSPPQREPPFIRLKKIDLSQSTIVNTLSAKVKRPRRKPKRLLEQEDQTPTSKTCSNNSEPNTEILSSRSSPKEKGGQSNEISKSKSNINSTKKKMASVDSKKGGCQSKETVKREPQVKSTIIENRLKNIQSASTPTLVSVAAVTEKICGEGNVRMTNEVSGEKLKPGSLKSLPIKKKKMKKKRLGVAKVNPQQLPPSPLSSAAVLCEGAGKSSKGIEDSIGMIQNPASKGLCSTETQECSFDSNNIPVNSVEKLIPLMDSKPRKGSIMQNIAFQTNASLHLSSDDAKHSSKTFSDVSVMCSSPVTTSAAQTESSSKIDVANQAQPIMTDRGTSIQVQVITETVEVQTPSWKVSCTSMGTQTDIVESLCLCQCTCLMKSQNDASTGIQEEFKPLKESKSLQTEATEPIQTQRSSRFTTPQNNRIKHTTPSRSPEKRKYESPTTGRLLNSVAASVHSKFLTPTIALKTPTTTRKYWSGHRENLSTPTDISPCTSFQTRGGKTKTPPSKEEYLMNALLRSACSPRNRRVSIKPRNLLVEAKKQETSSSSETIKREESLSERESLKSTENISSNQFSDVHQENSAEKLQSKLVEEPEYDFSVNSIYEYDETMASISLSSTSEAELTASREDAFDMSNQGRDGECEDNNADSAIDPSESDFCQPNQDSKSPQLTAFQKKRILSKHRSKIRLAKRRAATLDANRGVPDVFRIEYEPLKQPPSYKSVMKWLEAEKYRLPAENHAQKGRSTKLSGINGNSSDEEELPVQVRLFGGGNMSDEEDSDDPSSSIFIPENRRGYVVKPFTPPSVPNQETPVQNGIRSCSQETPRSILRPRGSLRRRSSAVSKRKIRWDDEERDESSSSQKRLKIEDGRDSTSDKSINLTVDSFIKTADISELDGPSFKNALGLENSMSNYQDVKAIHQCQFLTTMCIEVHCKSRNGLTPDPALDPLLAIFISITSDYPDNFRKPKECLNILFVDDVHTNGLSVENNYRMKAFSTEMDMINAFLGLVRFWDPDILVGFEVEKFSFGYLIQRGFHLGKDMAQELSRVLPPISKTGEKRPSLQRTNQEWNGTISGRIVLNIWRLLRHEISVQSYTFENAAYHILRRRVYKFSYKDLDSFWVQKMKRIKVIQYFTIRIQGVIQIMEKLDLINRTSELARLFGIQFYEVLSRGSQFRVESMMLRATKPQDFIAPSPTVSQRAKMRAPEYLPLILEPQSNYYTDPVAVLDFQSLYPSMMIAYNYDYASLLGRVEYIGSMDRFPLGCLDHSIKLGEVFDMKDFIHVSPAGVAFLDSRIVKGVLPEMLKQILETRQMVKRAMKKWKNEGASLAKVLDSRQLGLKLIANVTYGYTSANFSGRMPCVEVADSIVSKGRETLQRAINHVNENFDRWGGEVVYGDTDSMFVRFRGKSRNEAFKLAYEIAEEVTQANPKPVKLKFEKIYQPCILQSKKRYVGYAYETPDQEKPTYDAKGIETVRRDGCPAVRKILEKTLHILFTTNNPSKVESYVKLQFEKLFRGRVSMQDYIFAREYRGRSGYKPTASVPALELAKRFTEVDPRSEPLVSERVPYVVIYGDPNLPLIKLVRKPEEYFENPAMRLNAHYYIEKVIIPALNRCLKLAKMDASKWYLQMPRKFLRNILEQKPAGQRTLDNFILHQNCFRCDGKAEGGLCSKCLEDENGSVVFLQEVVRDSKLKLNNCIEICDNCSGESGSCISVDCPILHKLTRYKRDQVRIDDIERELNKLDW